MTAVQQRLTQARVPKDAIRTLGYDLEQEFDVMQGRRVPREFVARNTIEVRVDEIARVGELLDVAVQGGATSVSGVRFDIQDRAADRARRPAPGGRRRTEPRRRGRGRRRTRTVDRVSIEDSRDGVVAPPRPMMTLARRPTRPDAGSSQAVDRELRSPA